MKQKWPVPAPYWESAEPKHQDRYLWLIIRLRNAVPIAMRDTNIIHKHGIQEYRKYSCISGD